LSGFLRVGFGLPSPALVVVVGFGLWVVWVFPAMRLRHARFGWGALVGRCPAAHDASRASCVGLPPPRFLAFLSWVAGLHRASVPNPTLKWTRRVMAVLWVGFFIRPWGFVWRLYAARPLALR